MGPLPMGGSGSGQGAGGDKGVVTPCDCGARHCTTWVPSCGGPVLVFETFTVKGQVDPWPSPDQPYSSHRE